MTAPRRLAYFGLGDIAIGALLWGLSDWSTVGVALVVVGVAVLLVAAFRTGRATDPDTALHNERADEQRLRDQDAAVTESGEGRPPPTGA